MKLTKGQRALLERVGNCSSLGTSDWRGYVPLSNLGLVEMRDSVVFGRDYRFVKITKKGYEVLRALETKAPS